MKPIHYFVAVFVVSIFYTVHGNALAVNDNNIRGIWKNIEGKNVFYHVVKENGKYLAISKSWRSNKWILADSPNRKWKLENRVFSSGVKGSFGKRLKIVRITRNSMTARPLTSSDRTGARWGRAKVFKKISSLPSWAQSILDNNEAIIKDEIASKKRNPVIGSSHLPGLWGDVTPPVRPNYNRHYFNVLSNGKLLVITPGVNNSARLYSYRPLKCHWEMSGSYVYQRIYTGIWYLFFKIENAGDSTITVRMRNYNYSNANQMWSRPKTYKRLYNTPKEISAVVQQYK